MEQHVYRLRTGESADDMTPLYSKETADQICGEIQILIESGCAYPDAMAAKRLIKNGDEVMNFLTHIRELLCDIDFIKDKDQADKLIKKIKGEG